MDDIKINFDSVTISDFWNFIANTEDISAVLDFADKIVVGGIKERPMTDLPAIFAKMSGALQEESDSITIAIVSILRYLKGDDDE